MTFIFIRTGHSGSVKQAVFSPSGDFILSHGFDKAARLWLTRDLEALVRMRAIACSVYDLAEDTGHRRSQVDVAPSIVIGLFDW